MESNGTNGTYGTNEVTATKGTISLHGSTNGYGEYNGLCHAKAQPGSGMVEKSQRTIDPRNYDDLLWLAEDIRSRVQLAERPKVAIICGSGLGELAEMLSVAQTIPFADIHGFPTTHVVGHKGNMVFGFLGSTYVVCLQGRFHPYENQMDLTLCAMPVRLMHILGARMLIVSNAAGGVNPRFHYGDLMLIKDHISMPAMAGFSPLVGLNDPRFGPRFVSMHDAYDRELRRIAMAIAEQADIPIHEGIYVMCGGPQYESPAEVSFLKSVGADALGMSTCHEVIAAIHCEMRVLGFSLITNLCSTDADTSVEVSHEEVLQAGKDAGHRACLFVESIIKHIETSGLV